MVQRLGCYDHKRYNLLRFLRCTVCELLEWLPGWTDYKISRSERTPLHLNLSQMSSDTKDSGGLGMFALCKEITSLGKHTTRLQRTVQERKTTKEVE